MAVRVLLDVSPIGSRPEARTGLARVALDLASALSDDPGIELATCAWGSVEAGRQFHEVRSAYPRIRGVAIEPGLLERIYLAVSDRTRNPSRLTGAAINRLGQAVNVCRNPLRGLDLRRFDIIHSTYARIPPVVRRQPRPVVVTVHDLTPLKLAPAIMPRHQVGIMNRILRAIAPTDWVVCVSEHTRRDFLEHTGHPEGRTLVIPNGVDHGIFFPVRDSTLLDRVRTRYGIGSGPFVLTLSSLSSHKNLALLAEAWPLVERTCPGALLVVAGGAATHRDTVAALFARHGATTGIRFTGFVCDEDFRALASACQAFLFPSLYEGFGLPVLEAMACGAPVISSNATALPEVTRSAATLVDPHDVQAWVDPITTAVSALPRDEPDAASVARAGDFSWSATAGKHARLYRDIAAVAS